MNDYPPSVTGFAEHAIEYAQRGLKVIPVNWIRDDGRCSCDKPSCASPGKHPFYKFAPSGVTSATNDVGTISQWWSQHPQMNIGIATGPESGIAVLDVDVNDGKRGLESLQKLISDCGIAIPSCHQVEARSGSGGMHYYFRYPRNGVGNSVNLRGYPGLDLKGARGYIVAPPSANANGEYGWVTPWDHQSQLPELPDFIVRLGKAPTKSLDSAAPADGALPGSVEVLRGVSSIERSLVKREPTGNDKTDSGIDFEILTEILSQDLGLSDRDLRQALIWSWKQNGLDRQKQESYFANTIDKARVCASQRQNRLTSDKRSGSVLRCIDPKDWDRDPDPLSPVVESFLYKGWLTNLAGNAKVGKSWLSLQLIGSVLDGTKFLGLETTPVSALHVCLEMNLGMIKRRFCQLEQSLGLKQPVLGDRYTLIANELGKPGLFLDLTRTDHCDDLREQIGRAGSGLVVLDTLYRFTGDIDPNTPAINIVFSNLSNIAREMNCAILTLDHTRKENASSKPTSAAYGSAFKGGSSSVNALLARPSTDLWKLSAEGYTDEPIEIAYRRPKGKGFGCVRTTKVLSEAKIADLFKRYGEPDPRGHVMSKTKLAKALKTEKIETNQHNSLELAQEILDDHCLADNSGPIRKKGKAYVWIT